MDLLIRNGRVVDPANGLDAAGDVLIQAGRVARVGPRLEAPAGTETIDAEGRVIAPGFIDIHVHLREPGQEYKETIASGTRAAAAGGFAAVACMANTQPVNDTRAVTDYILAEARARGVVRVYPIGAVTRGLGGRELAELGELAEAGCVAYSDDGRPVMNSALLRRALEYAQAFGRPIISHAEDAALSEGGVMHEGFVSTDLGLRGIPAAAEEIMVARDIALADLTGTPVHIAHVSTAAAVRLLREAKARGVAVTGEVTPHHLLLTDEALRAYDPNAKMAPPLRSKRDVEACREALADGTLDAIATDHAPHALTDKEVELDNAANGIVGLETAVALCLTHLVRERVLDLPDPDRAADRGPGARPRAAGREPRPRGARRRDGPGSRARARDRARALPLEGPQHTVRRPGLRRRAVADGRRRPRCDAGGRRRRGERVVIRRERAVLALADGRVFEGEPLGARGEAVGEVVFNTAMSGYQEILTDPSYKGQIVCMTYPHIGNTGVNDEDPESRHPWAEGFVVREASPVAASWRATATLDAYLREHGIVGIQGIDTRALTRHLRDRGAQEGVIATGDVDPRAVVAKAKASPGLRRAGPGQGGHVPGALRVGRVRVAPGRGVRATAARALPRGRVRLGDQAEHPPAADGARAAG